VVVGEDTFQQVEEAEDSHQVGEEEPLQEAVGVEIHSTSVEEAYLQGNPFREQG
jgi:hypothetical protein